MSRTLFSNAVLTIILTCAATLYAQDVKVGYDKSIDFAKYRSFSWADLSHPPARPMLYALIVNAIEHELSEKGLAKSEGAGDLLLFPAGGVDSSFSMNAGAPVGNYLNVPLSVSTGSWVGPYTMTGEGLSPVVHEGTLVVSLVDRQSGQLVWEGRVTDKFDQDKKSEGAERVGKCINKLFKGFPPRPKQD